MQRFSGSGEPVGHSRKPADRSLGYCRFRLKQQSSCAPRPMGRCRRVPVSSRLPRSVACRSRRLAAPIFSKPRLAKRRPRAQAQLYGPVHAPGPVTLRKTRYDDKAVRTCRLCAVSDIGRPLHGGREGRYRCGGRCDVVDLIRNGCTLLPPMTIFLRRLIQAGPIITPRIIRSACVGSIPPSAAPGPAFRQRPVPRSGYSTA